MTSPQLRYFKQVLGVHSVVMPEKLLEDMDLKSLGHKDSPNLALVTEELSPENTELIAKMFASVGIDNFFIVNHRGLGSDQLNDHIENRKMIWTYGETLNLQSSAKVFPLPSLLDLQKKPEAKRKAWNKIKVLKE